MRIRRNKQDQEEGDGDNSLEDEVVEDDGLDEDEGEDGNQEEDWDDGENMRKSMRIR